MPFLGQRHGDPLIDRLAVQRAVEQRHRLGRPDPENLRRNEHALVPGRDLFRRQRTGLPVMFPVTIVSSAWACRMNCLVESGTGHSSTQVPQEMHSSVILYAIDILLS